MPRLTASSRLASLLKPCATAANPPITHSELDQPPRSLRGLSRAEICSGVNLADHCSVGSGVQMSSMQK